MEPKIPSLPFFTRDMLKFGNKMPIGLRLSSASDGEAVAILKGITRNGIINLELRTLGNGKISSIDVGLDDIPIMVGVVAEEDNAVPGQLWATVELMFEGGVAIPLCSGFLYQTKGITWPMTQQVDAVPGRGYIIDKSSVNPAAGAEVLITVPDGEMWKVHNGSIKITTDATVASRRPHIVFKPTGSVEIHCFSSYDIGASVAVQLGFAKWGAGLADDSNFAEMIPIPQDLWLPPQSTIVTKTQNLQAGDDYDAMHIIVEKFFGFAME